MWYQELEATLLTSLEGDEEPAVAVEEAISHGTLCQVLEVV